MRQFGIAMLVVVLFLFSCSQKQDTSSAGLAGIAVAPALETITLEVDGIA